MAVLVNVITPSALYTQIPISEMFQSAQYILYISKQQHTHSGSETCAAVVTVMMVGEWGGRGQREDVMSDLSLVPSACLADQLPAAQPRLERGRGDTQKMESQSQTDVRSWSDW